MRKKICFIFLFVFVGLLCSGCDGNITRVIRHAGFTLSGTFECGKFFPVNKGDTTYDRIRYFTGTHLIDEDGKIYELSLSKKYYNEDNCLAADTSIKVIAIFDNRVVKSMDNKYYYLSGQNNVPGYSAVPTSDNSYAIYDLLLKDANVVKAVSADTSQGLYYVLKTDGNIYGYTISAQNRDTPPRIVGTQIAFNKSDYDGTYIVDFNYAGNSLNTFVRTEAKLYRMRMTNGKECTKYAGVECQFEMREDPIFEKYNDRIVTFNGSVLITDYKKMFTVAS